MNEGLLKRRTDWQDAAERYSIYRDFLRHEQRGRGHGLDCPSYSRLFEVLGGPFLFTPDGRYGLFPYTDVIGDGFDTWEECSAVPIERVAGLDFNGLELTDDERLMVWPWVAKFAVDYARTSSGPNRGGDITPSKLDEILAQVSQDANRLMGNLNALDRAEHMTRPYSFDQLRKRIALLQINGRLRDATGEKGLDRWGFEGFAQRLRNLDTTARDARGALASADIEVKKPAENAGIAFLTVASAYLWTGMTGHNASAARRTSRTMGEQSAFVLFVQSIARLQSNNVPTIAQVDKALKEKLPILSEDVFALEWQDGE